MRRFRYTIPTLLLLGNIAVIVAGFGYAPEYNPSSNIPTLLVGVSMILLAISLSVVGKRENISQTDSQL